MSTNVTPASTVSSTKTFSIMNYATDVSKEMGGSIRKIRNVLLGTSFFTVVATVLVAALGYHNVECDVIASVLGIALIGQLVGAKVAHNNRKYWGHGSERLQQLLTGATNKDTCDAIVRKIYQKLIRNSLAAIATTLAVAGAAAFLVHALHLGFNESVDKFAHIGGISLLGVSALLMLGAALSHRKKNQADQLAKELLNKSSDTAVSHLPSTIEPPKEGCQTLLSEGDFSDSGSAAATVRSGDDDYYQDEL